MTIVILAGGRATRLPGKLMHTIGGEPLLLRVFRQLTSTGLPCIVSIREPLPAKVFRRLRARRVTDAHGDAGPLGGLASAAARVYTPLLFAAAGDLPNIDAAVVDALERCYHEEYARSGVAPEVVLPRHENGNVEPLAALYDTAALRESAKRTLASGRMKVTQALEGLRVIHYRIPAHEASKFSNVNTAADLASIFPS